MQYTGKQKYFILQKNPVKEVINVLAERTKSDQNR